MSLLPIRVSVVNKPDDFLLHLLLSVQSQAQQSPNCLGPAYPAVPLASVLCINICLHQWLYCTDREAAREEEFAPIGACAIVFCCSETWGGAVTLWPTSPPGSTHPALIMCCPRLTMHHSVLLLCSSVTGRSLCCHCAFPLLHALSLGLMFSSPLQPSPRVSSLCQRIA